MHVFHAGPEHQDLRLDHYLSALLPDVSRSRIQAWIKEGRVRVNGLASKPGYALRGNEHIEVEPADPPPLKAVPEDLPLDVLYQDASVIAINKPAGMVVHAGAGVVHGTLVNALLHHFQQLSSGSDPLRPGIVHRLDRYTSGVLLVAKTDTAHQDLARQFASRSVKKIYLALVHGVVQRDTGVIESPVARDPVHRTRMTTKLATGRSALTSYFVLQRMGKFSYLKVDLGTGRTHQIRVHLASIGHPVVGDALYGAPKQIPQLPGLQRFLLHAHQITFRSPASGESVSIEAPVPAEFLQAVQELK